MQTLTPEAQGLSDSEAEKGPEVWIAKALPGLQAFLPALLPENLL